MDGVVVVVGGCLWTVTASNKIWKLQFMVSIFLTLIFMQSVMSTVQKSNRLVSAYNDCLGWFIGW